MGRMCSSQESLTFQRRRVGSESPNTGFQAGFTGVQSPLWTGPVASEPLRWRPCTCVWVWAGHGVICLDASQVGANGAREMSGGQTPALPLLASRLLFYQAFRSWPSAPRRLICQTAFTSIYRMPLICLSYPHLYPQDSLSRWQPAILITAPTR